MGIFKELYRDDLLNRLANHVFAETTVGNHTKVTLTHNDTIDSVTNSSGTARFNYASGPTLLVGQTITTSGFTTNPGYNTTNIISATDGTTYFEITGISFGSDETGTLAALKASSQKLVVDDAYQFIRDSLIGHIEDVMFSITKTQRDALTISGEGEFLFFQTTDGQLECFNGTAFEVIGGTEWTIRSSTTVQTTDDTTTVIDSFTLVDGETYIVLINVVGAKSDGSERCGVIKQALVYRSGGSAVREGNVTLTLSEFSDSNWFVDIVVSGNDVQATVKGLAATTVTWKCSMQFIDH